MPKQTLEGSNQTLEGSNQTLEGSLTAISPIDGRYHGQTKELSKYFSESALIHYRIKVELDYLRAIAKVIPQLNQFPINKLNNSDFQNHQAIRRIKAIEKITRHDVKAVEYYLKEQFQTDPELQAYQEWIHFGLTSQDINQTALALQMTDSHHQQLLPILNQLHIYLSQLITTNIPMLSRTHGQPASPTTLGKEIAVFSGRLNTALLSFQTHVFHYKLGGAVGNFNAHQVAFPNINWPHLADQLYPDLKRTQITTQIEPYDNLAEYCHQLVRINNILIDLNRDLWHYISLGYFRQSVQTGQIGSSTMPHKINPINFENSEGNLGLANALLNHFANKLPISRLQRDLTDSTTVRNVGVALAHCLLAYQNLSTGLQKITPDPIVIAKDLDQRWEILTEAIQTILRRENYSQPYEALKTLTQTQSESQSEPQSESQSLTKKQIHEFIDNLEIDPSVKMELKSLTPSNYIGLASQMN